MEFRVVISGDRRVALKFDRFPEAARAALLSRITDLTAQLYAGVAGAAPERTGKLRREIGMHIDSYENRITGRVSLTAEFAKAAALEYGSHRSISVRAHQQRLAHVFDRQIEPESVEVAAFHRTTNIIERRFLRGPLAAMEPEIAAALEEALNAAAAEAA